MKKIKLFAVFAVVAGMLLMGPGLVGYAKADLQTKCPVMGGKIDKKVYADYEGNRVYFCCSYCVGEFKKNPAKYLKKMEAEGVELEKTPK